MQMQTHAGLLQAARSARSAPFTARGAKARQVAPADLHTALRDGRARRVEEGSAAVERALAAVVG
jgi:hypothetical protein